MKYSQAHSPIINQLYPHHLILLPLLFHHLLLNIPHHLHMYLLLKETSLPHPLPMHQINKEMAVNKLVTMKMRVMMNQAKMKQKT